MLPLILIATTTVAPSYDLDARLTFLEHSLEQPKLHARVWWWGWLSVYSAGAIVQGVRLAVVDPTDEDAAAQRADLTVSIVKAVGGVISQLAQPLNAMEGAEAMYAIEGEGTEADLARLAAGEAALAENARESGKRFYWLRHALSLAVNIAGGLIIWLGYDDLQRGLINAGVGIAVGELAIWTQPWEPRESYQLLRERSEAHTPDSQAALMRTR